jgi:chromosome segregation and condensation protein ScpB
MTELHNIDDNVKKDIVLSAVQSENVKLLHNTFSDCTADSGIDFEENKNQVKLLLKDIAKQIIREVYEEQKSNCSHLHQSVHPTTTN